MKRNYLSGPVAASLLAISSVAYSGEPVSAPGPQGTLEGTLEGSVEGGPLILILPGSGPTDRDGNNPLGVKAAPYRLLAEALAKRGIGSLRADKRGMFGSAGAIADANAVTIEDYAADATNWVGIMRKKTGAECVWLLGHSEGGVIALSAAQEPGALCGLILVASPGRKLGAVMRQQLRANPANAPILPDALSAIDALEAGTRVDVSAMHPALQGLFAPAVQGFLINLFAQDPSAMAAKDKLPLLIVQGGNDLQVGLADAEALKAARPDATLVVLPDMNHVLKDVAHDDSAANMAAYRDPDLPVSEALVDAIAAFVK